MSNSLLTINMITREAVRLWKNSNAFLQNIDMQYDDSFAKTGAKIGTALRVRLPNDYTVRTGAAASVQDTAETSTTLLLATQKGVDVSFSSADRTMSLDDYSERVLAPAINNLAGAIAADIMTGTEGGVCNFVANTDVSNNILNPVAATYLNAGAALDVASAPLGDRKVVNDPFTQARVISSLAGLFNPVADIARQYKTGMMQQALGFDWLMDQTVIKHTSGTFTAGTVSTGSQTGLTLATNAITGTLTQGDIITIAGVYGVNRITKTSTGTLRQFVVTAPAASGATSISIYPAITPAVGGVAVQYQTVTASPAPSAAISLVTIASSVYRKNIVYAPQAVTMATADLELPRGVHEAARESFDGVSMRMVTAYNVSTDQFITRLDILYGYLFVRPEWACVVADAI
jgi:hypothetical protein